MQLIIIYDASKVIEVIEIIKEHRKDVYRIGFFDSVDPQNAKLICRTFEQFNALPEGQAKLVFSIIIISINFSFYFVWNEQQYTN